jgi:hypothetical protein
VKAINVIATLAMTAVSMAAADVQVDDLRAGAGLLSKNFTGGSNFTVTSSNGSVNGSSSGDGTGTDAHRNSRGELQWMAGHLGDAGGFIYGVDLADNRATFDQGSTTATYDTPVIDLNLGYGYAVTHNLHFELTGFGGFGWTYFKISSQNNVSEKFHEHYLEYGARLGGYYTFDNRLQVGVEIPYLVGNFHPSFSSSDSNGDTVSYSNHERNKGLGLLVQVGVRL